VSTRVLQCFSDDSTDPTVPISDRLCQGTISKPDTDLLIDCNLQPCQTYQYRLADWGACSASCGTGLQSRELQCVNAKTDSSPVSDVYCATLPRSTAELTKDCSGVPCTTFMYRLTGWTPCSATCGGGSMTRSLACIDSTGADVALTKCNAYLRPTQPLTLDCATQPCVEYSFDCTSWGACSVSCGSGTHERTCACKGTDGIGYDDANCPLAARTSRPATHETCNTGRICRTYAYSVSPWCTLEANPCAQAKVEYTRAFQCLGSLGEVVDAQQCVGKPPKTSYVCDADAVVGAMYQERCGTLSPTAAPTDATTEAPTTAQPVCRGVPELVATEQTLSATAQLLAATNLSAILSAPPIKQNGFEDGFTIFAAVNTAWLSSALTGYNTAVPYTVDPNKYPIVAAAVVKADGVDGLVTFTQLTETSPTVVALKVNGARTNKNFGTYHIHEFPIDTSLPADQACSAASVGGHFNPTNASGTCDPNKSGSCEVGDLSGKYGLLTSTNFDLQFSDFYLPLTGNQSIIGRSIVLHDDAGATWICATIVQTSSKDMSVIQPPLPLPTWAPVPTQDSTSQIQSCVDVQSECPAWRVAGECTGDARTWMLLNCALSCGACTSRRQADEMMTRTITSMSAPQTIREAVQRLIGLASADPTQANYLNNLLSFQIVKGRYTLLKLKSSSTDVMLDTLAAPRQLRIAGNTDSAQGQSFSTDTVFQRHIVTPDIEVCGGILHWVNTVYESAN